MRNIVNKQYKYFGRNGDPREPRARPKSNKTARGNSANLLIMDGHGERERRNSVMNVMSEPAVGWYHLPEGGSGPIGSRGPKTPSGQPTRRCMGLWGPTGPDTTLHTHIYFRYVHILRNVFVKDVGCVKETVSTFVLWIIHLKEILGKRDQIRFD